jgi:signal transduction histidine kinase
LDELVKRICELTGARYGLLNILSQNGQPDLLITIGANEADIDGLDLAALKHSILDVLSIERDVIRSGELDSTMGPGRSLPPAVLDSFLGITIHARGRLLGRLLFADKQGNRQFDQDDEALALALAANLAGAVENALLYQKTEQRVRELTALYEITRTLTAMKETSDVYTHLATQVAQLLDAESCAFFIYHNGTLRCQAPGYGLPPEVIPHLRFRINEEDPAYALIHSPHPLMSNEVPQDPDLEEFAPLLARLGIRRLLACRIPIDEHQLGLLLAADKRSGERFNEQDRHLVSIMALQVSNVLQRALLQNRQREHAQVQSALLQVSQTISSVTNLDELLQIVAEITHQLVGCDHCLMASWEERQAAFIIRAESGLDPAASDAILQVELRPADIAAVDRLIEARVPVLLTHPDIRETVPAWIQNLLGMRNSLIVPLVIQDRVVGLIGTVYTSEGHAPGEREIALVSGIARQAAFAIENANLFEDLQLHATRLERAYRELKELDEHKTQFIQNVSHELRTPMTLIKGYLELLLQEEMGALSDRQRKGLAIIAEKTQALGRLILDIVTVQSIDAALLELDEFDLSQLVQATLASQQADVPDLRLESELPDDLPWVNADCALVERALDLLLENALKFSPDGGVITIRARPDGGMMHIEVEDQGIGIPQKAQPYIFDRFYQVDGSTTRRFSGAGLGLSIVKQVAEAHGGDVGVHSVEGQGSTIYFTIPLASPP